MPVFVLLELPVVHAINVVQTVILKKSVLDCHEKSFKG